MAKVIACIPTRGLVFTQCPEAVLQNFEEIGQEPHILFTHNQPIPEAHNSLAMAVLGDVDASHAWFVEEDHAPLADTLKKLLEWDDDIVTVHYKAGGQDVVHYMADGSVAWAGLGCTLIKRKVFEGMAYPYFRSDKDFTIITNGKGEVIGFSELEVKSPKRYGKHDIYFYLMAGNLGFSITTLDRWCSHLKVIEYGEVGTNNGCHQIGEKE